MKSFSFHSRLDSFRYAAHGIRQFFREEPNAWVHLAATTCVFILSCWLGVTQTEAVLLVVVTGLVWVAEIINTAIENVVDLISPGWHAPAGLIKDLAAGAVLLAAITALITGAIIFIPRII